jgi:hypothetical protein
MTYVCSPKPPRLAACTITEALVKLADEEGRLIAQVEKKTGVIRFASGDVVLPTELSRFHATKRADAELLISDGSRLAGSVCWANDLGMLIDIAHILTRASKRAEKKCLKLKELLPNLGLTLTTLQYLHDTGDRIFDDVMQINTFNLPLGMPGEFSIADEVREFQRQNRALWTQLSEEAPVPSHR